MKKIILLIIFSFGLTACFSVQNVERNQYLFEITMPHKLINTQPKTVLEIDDIAVLPQFAGISFVYRRDQNHYLTDYYNTFMTTPANQIQDVISNYLNHTGLFHLVANQPDIAPPDFSLNAKVLALYADYRNKTNPKAVISIQFIVIKNADQKILLTQTFTKRVPLKAKNSISLMHAWNQGLSKILRHFTVKLMNVINK